MLAFYLTVFDYFYDLESQTIEHRLATINNVAIRKARDLQTIPPKNRLILFYTPFFTGHWLDYPRLGPLRPPIFDGTFSFQECEVPWCEATYDKNRISEASAVGFHARDIPTSFVFPLKRSAQQIWFYYVMENPLNVAMNYSTLNNQFNWTMSYRRNSEIHIPYGGYRLKRNPLISNKSYAKDKTRFAVWMASNCVSGERNDYVTSLMSHIPVTIYGKCGVDVCPLPRRSLECKKLLRQHKFYLSFENGNCIDYITEKYWENAIGNDIVPVVMGAADYKALAIPGSYINVMDYSTPEQLAEYLKYLDRNHTAYNEYFRWKEKYEQIAPRTACTLCKQIHNSSLRSKSRIYGALEKFWDKHHCRKLNLVQAKKETPDSLPFSVMLENVKDLNRTGDKRSLRSSTGPTLNFSEEKPHSEFSSTKYQNAAKDTPTQNTDKEQHERHFEKQTNDELEFVSSPSLDRQQNSAAGQLKQEEMKHQYLIMPAQQFLSENQLQSQRPSEKDNVNESSNVLLKDF